MHVYLTRSDWCAVMGALERQVPLRYVRYGLVDGELCSWTSAAGIEDFGVAPTGDQASGPQFLLLPADVEPVARVAERRVQGERRVVDRQDNPQSVIVRPGGAFGALAVIVGEVPEVVGDAWSERVVAALRQEVRAFAKELHGFYVGPEALLRMRAGARLTPYVDGDTLYDLRYPG